MRKHLVLVGGGHAHMLTLQNLHVFVSRGHEVTVIGPSPYHYYSGMGPGMLSRMYTPDEIRFATEQVVKKQGGKFVLDRAIMINANEKSILLQSGNSIKYDVLSVNAGSHVPWNMVTGDQEDVFSVKPIETLLAAQKRILELPAQKKFTIGIVGGGPSSLEIAGNIWRLVKDYGKFTPVLQVFTGSELMSRFPGKIRNMAYRSLRERNIELIEHDYVETVGSGEVIMESGRRYGYDIIFLAVGVKPSPIFRDSDLPTGPDGGLLVNRFLQSVSHPEIFGGGDCIYFQEQPLDKVGVYAVRENPVLYHNLLASLENNSLKAFDPGGPYLLIFNLGNGRGILAKNSLIFDGRLAFMIKDYIDRKFMRQFQAMEK